MCVCLCVGVSKQDEGLFTKVREHVELEEPYISVAHKLLLAQGIHFIRLSWHGLNKPESPSLECLLCYKSLMGFIGEMSVLSILPIITAAGPASPAICLIANSYRNQNLRSVMCGLAIIKINAVRSSYTRSSCWHAIGSK